MNLISRLAIWGTAVLGTIPEQSGTRSPETERSAIEARVDSVLDRYVALGTFSGTVLVARDGQILLNKGYGFADRDTKRMNSPETQFRIASISKQLTETAIAQMIAQKKLKSEMQLSEILPEYRHASRITIQQLVEHTAGVPHINDLPWYAEASQTYQTPEQLYARFKDDSLDFEPGTKRKYSNGGFVLLARALERLTGLEYGRYMSRYVFGPAGMTMSGHETTALPPANLAKGYTTSPRGLVRAPDVDMSIKIGGGSIYATTGDLLRWTQALRSGQIAEPAVMEKLWQKRQRDGRSYFYAVGHSPGFTATLLQYVEPNVTVIVLANHYGRTTDDIAFLLAGEALGTRYVSGVERYIVNAKFAEVPVNKRAMARFAGDYVQRGPNARFRLSVEGGEMIYTLADHHTTYRLIPLSSTTFLDPMLWGVLRLKADTTVTGTWEWFDYPELKSTVERVNPPA